MSGWADGEHNLPADRDPVQGPLPLPGGDVRLHHGAQSHAGQQQNAKCSEYFPPCYLSYELLKGLIVPPAFRQLLVKYQLDVVRCAKGDSCQQKLWSTAVGGTKNDVFWPLFCLPLLAFKSSLILLPAII